MADRRTYWQRLRDNFYTPKDPPYLDGQPKEIRDFMKYYRPQTDRDRALFNYMKAGMEKYGFPIQQQYHILAQIGDPDILRYLSKHYPHNENGILQNVAVNPRCPEDIAQQCLYHSDPEVRCAAVQCTKIPDDTYLELAYRETDPFVQDALKERLGFRYPFNQPKDPITVNHEIEAYIGRAFDKNWDHDTMVPILAAYEAYRKVPYSPDAERKLHDTFAEIADTTLIEALYERYPSDDAMLAKLINNPNCPKELAERGLLIFPSDEYSDILPSDTKPMKPKSSLDTALKSAMTRSQDAAKDKQHPLPAKNLHLGPEL